ncbi:MAG: OmpH family outer membrane protein [Rikenellaceae bacterium]
MRKFFLLVVVSLFTISASFAQQKLAYIYSEQVFNAMPEYQKAVETLDQYARNAQITAEAKLKNVQVKFAEYKRLEGTMSDAMRSTMRAEIVKLEQEANSYEEQFFEEGGPMTTKRDELMSPLEDKVLKAVEQIAKSEGFDMILDLSVAKIALYKNPDLDYTQKVIEMVADKISTNATN